jgi:anti-anti-sigma factor
MSSIDRSSRGERRVGASLLAKAASFAATSGPCYTFTRLTSFIQKDRFMSVTSDISEDGQELTIKIRGRFDFAAHQGFRSAYEETKDVSRFIVDLQGANYLDSSALGMLLLLRDHGGGERADVRLINCNDDVLKILAISNFNKLFRIG